MSDQFQNQFGCDPSDCASCQGGCNVSDAGGHKTITLTMDDDTEVECAILTVYPVGEKEYIALLPLDEDGQNRQGEVYLYTFSTTESGDPVLSNIEDDDEYQLAADGFNRILENAKTVAAADPEE